MVATVYHQDRRIHYVALAYAGRTNVFHASLKVPPVQKDYEVLKVVVTASRKEAVNFGMHEKTWQLKP